LNETAPALWLVVATGVVTGLLSRIVGDVVLGLPFVRVRVRHELHVDDSGPRVESYVRVANIRGRPVTIDAVFILGRRGKGSFAPFRQHRGGPEQEEERA